tara:strand:- start:1120 stop:1707 length:588 start_codon:yes stop_codon:yes gene_type:complete
MIIKNEKHCITRCFDSIVGHVSQICVVDTGSVDGTQKLVSQYIKGHIHTSWQFRTEPFSDFSTMRNITLEMANKADWVLIIDADETILPDSWTRLNRLLFDHKDPPISIALPRHQWIDLDMTRKTGPYPDYHIRIWQNHRGIRYQGKVHEQPRGGGVWNKLTYFDGAHIEHFNRVYLDDVAWKQKKQFYRDLAHG